MLDMLELSPLEEAVYDTLVDAPPSTADELQPAVQADLAVIHAVLDTMEGKGLVSRIPGEPCQFVAVAPDVALDVLLLQREEHLKRLRMYVDKLTTRFHAAAAGRRAAHPIEIVTGRDAVRLRTRQIQHGARHEVRAIDKPPYADDPGFRTTTEQDHLDRGVRYRVLYDPAGLEQQHNIHGDLEHTIADGEEAKILPHAPGKLVLADDRVACLPLQVAPTEITSIIVVHRSGLLEAVAALFETLWEQGLPFTIPIGPDPAESPPGAPSPQEKRILALLAAGLPDSVIAKQLGLSTRTIQRRLQDLANRPGATTRFQAGVLAALRGWTSHRP